MSSAFGTESSSSSGGSKFLSTDGTSSSLFKFEGLEGFSSSDGKHSGLVGSDSGKVCTSGSSLGSSGSLGFEGSGGFTGSGLFGSKCLHFLGMSDSLEVSGTSPGSKGSGSGNFKGSHASSMSGLTSSNSLVVSSSGGGSTSSSGNSSGVSDSSSVSSNSSGVSDSSLMSVPGVRADTVIPVLQASTLASTERFVSATLLADESSGAIGVSVTISLAVSKSITSVTVNVEVEENVGRWGHDAVIPVSVGSATTSGNGDTATSLLADESSGAIGVSIAISLASVEATSSVSVNGSVPDAVLDLSLGSVGSDKGSGDKGSSDEHNYIYL